MTRKGTAGDSRGWNLTGRGGEYRVAAELMLRHNVLALPAGGTMRGWDLLTLDAQGRRAIVQVKTKAPRSKHWQFRLPDFCDAAGTPHSAPPIPDLTTVLVSVGIAPERDRFFVLPWTTLRDLVLSHHRAFLAKHGGRRPKNPDSPHTAPPASDFAPFEDRWEMIVGLER